MLSQSENKINCPVIGCKWNGTIMGCFRLKGHLWNDHISSEMKKDSSRIETQHFLKKMRTLITNTPILENTITSDDEQQMVRNNDNIPITEISLQIKQSMNLLLSKLPNIKNDICIRDGCKNKTESFIVGNPIRHCTTCKTQILEKCKTHISMARIFKIIKAYPRKNDLKHIINSSKTVYKTLEWGQSEAVYQEALRLELAMSRPQWNISTEVPLTINYKNRMLGAATTSRIDIMITTETGHIIIVELKAINGGRDSLDKANQQCKRYLKLLGENTTIGLVVNFPDKKYKQIQSNVVVM